MDSVAAILGGLREVARRLERARDELDEHLVATREAGATFDQIAQSLGLNSRQAAQRRYAMAQHRIEQRRRRHES